MIARIAIVAGWLLAPLIADAAPVPRESSAHPLLEFAREREKTRERDTNRIVRSADVSEARHALDQGHVPGDAECAQSIGAPRFANLYTELAGALAATGDLAGAAAAYRSAYACRPRDDAVLGALGGVLFDARDYPAARAAVDAALAINPRSVGTNRLAGNIAYVEQHWTDAITRFRYVASSDTDRDQAGYGQLMFWLAQARAGMAKPEFVARSPGEGWPQPLMLYMRDEYTESELVARVVEGDDDSSQQNSSTDERLCEALFYVGEAHWARGHPDVARDYFAALVNIRVLYFLEHGLALAEIARLRSP